MIIPPMPFLQKYAPFCNCIRLDGSLLLLRQCDKQLIQIINKYLTSHEKILDDCCTLLHDAGAKEKEVSVFSKALSTIQAKIKMMMDDDKSTAAALLTDGCGMGVKTISEELNKYKMAGDEAKDIAKRLRKIEEDMIGDLQPML